MAEIAAIFHWPLSELEALSAEDLLFWHDKATGWWNRVRAGKEE